MIKEINNLNNPQIFENKEDKVVETIADEVYIFEN